MADGGGYQHYQQAAHRSYMPPLPHQYGRVGRGSPPRQNDTPSPSRSPGPQSPGYINFGSGQGQQGHPQHLLLNGAGGGPSHQRYATMHMNTLQSAHKYQQNQQQHHQQHQPHPQHNAHHQQQQQHQIQQQSVDHSTNHSTVNHNGTLGHAHSYSGSMPNANFGSPQHLTNGNSSMANAPLHWREQLKLAQESRDGSQPHNYARMAANKTRTGGGSQNITMMMTGGLNDNTDDLGAEEVSKRSGTAVVKKATTRQEWLELDFGGQGLRALSPSLFGYTFLTKLYVCHNKLIVLPPAIGKMKHLNFLDASHNQISSIPGEVGMLTSLKQLLLFDNRITQLPGELGTLFQLELLGIEGNPLEESFKKLIMAEGTKAMIVELREKCQIDLPPVDRDFHQLITDTNDVDRIQVLTYNILCERAATQQAYGYTPSWCLDWEFRKKIIMQELNGHQADILCLQEVDMGNFEDYLSPELAYSEYKGVYFPRTRARNMNSSEQKTVDGCATFYKSSKFNLLDKQCVDITRVAINRPDMKKTTDVFNRVMPRDNIATVTYLENKVTGTRLIVANIHVYWDQVFRDVKLIQSALLVLELQRIAENYAREPPATKNPSINGEPPVQQKYKEGGQIPLIICGDFNALPDSGVFEFFKEGKIGAHHPDFQGRDYGDFTAEGISHNFQLNSAYTNIKEKELPFTNYTPDFQGVIDYIWYTSPLIEVVSLLGAVAQEYMDKVAGFPNIHFPSDHLLLMAEFRIKPRPKEIVKPPAPDFGNTSSRR